ncbi:MAG: hypothetical protein RL095_51 [Verrucomicrobiota bacterium]|jgi:ankyrin repeat protein
MNPEAPTPLCAAVQAGDLAAIRRLLAEGQDPNQTDPQGWPLMYRAGVRGSIEILAALLEAGARLDGEEESTALCGACSEGHLEAIRWLIEKGAILNRPSPAHTPLHSAAAHPEAVRLLLSLGAQWDARDHCDSQPIHNAACFSLESLKIFQAAGASLDVKDCLGDQPIHYAADAGNCAVLEYLLQQGIPVDCPSGFARGQAIHSAASRGRIEAIRLLLGHGAKIDALERSGGFIRQPIHEAAACGSPETIGFLLSQGAQIDAPDESGNQPIHVAAGSGKIETLRFLLSQGARIDVVNLAGEQPIHKAVGSLETMHFLVEHGARWEARARNGDQLIHFAVASGEKETIEFLLRQGAAADAKNDEGGQPIHRVASIYASSLKRYDKQKAILDLLVAGGAKLDAADDSGRQLIHGLQMDGKDIPLINFLLDNGVRVDAALNCGLQPIHYAAIRAASECRSETNEFLAPLQVLLSRGADIHARDLDGWQAIHYATKYGRYTGPLPSGRMSPSKVPLLQFLVEKGADLNSETACGESVLDLSKTGAEGAEKRPSELTAWIASHLPPLGFFARLQRRFRRWWRAA